MTSLNLWPRYDPPFCGYNLAQCVRRFCDVTSPVCIGCCTSKFKSVSDRQDVDALMCSVFYISGFALLTVYLYLVIFYLAAFKRHYALRLAIAPEFFYCSYTCLFYVCSGLLK